MIGIIVADAKELVKFTFPLLKKQKIDQFVFSVYLIGKIQVVTVHSGIGLVNAAAATQSLINNFQIREIYSYGAVGGNKHMHLFDIVIPARIYFYDVTTPWYPAGQTPGEKQFYNNALKGDQTKNLASGNFFVSSEKQLSAIEKSLPIAIFDMETAAIAQIAFKNKVKVKVIKCVSDIVGSNQKSLQDINERIAEAGQKSFDEVIRRIKKSAR